MNLERRQPRSYAGVLGPVRPQRGRVVGQEADEVGAEDVAAPEGVRDVPVAENVPVGTKLQRRSVNRSAVLELKN